MCRILWLTTTTNPITAHAWYELSGDPGNLRSVCGAVRPPVGIAEGVERCKYCLQILGESE